MLRQAVVVVQARAKQLGQAAPRWEVRQLAGSLVQVQQVNQVRAILHSLVWHQEIRDTRAVNPVPGEGPPIQKKTVRTYAES